MRRAELARWIGRDADRPIEDLPWNRNLEVPEQELIENVSAHPPIAPAAARLEAARTEVDLAKAEKRPDWSAELSFEKRGPDYSDMVSLEFRVGLPLFPKNRQSPVIAAKLANVRVEEARQEAEIRMHRAEIESMVATWRLGRRRLEHFESSLLPLARDRSRAVLSAYGTGRGEIRAVLEAHRDELDLQREYVALEAEVVRAWAFLHLLHSTGATPCNSGSSSRSFWFSTRARAGIGSLPAARAQTCQPRRQANAKFSIGTTRWCPASSSTSRASRRTWTCSWCLSTPTRARRTRA